jgi:hypothetical protein
VKVTLNLGEPEPEADPSPLANEVNIKPSKVQKVALLVRFETLVLLTV